MGFLSRFEGKMEDTVEGAAEKMGGSSLSPVQIAKKAEKQMKREMVVFAGKQFAPTLYSVLVSAEDDARLFSYYPTLAGETETYLMAKAAEMGFAMDGQPLVRFIPEEELKRGKFDVVAEMVDPYRVSQLRDEEMQRYGLATRGAAGARRAGAPGAVTPSGMPAPAPQSYGTPQSMGGAYGTPGGWDDDPYEQDSYGQPLNTPIAGNAMGAAAGMGAAGAMAGNAAMGGGHLNGYGAPIEAQGHLAPDPYVQDAYGHQGADPYGQGAYDDHGYDAYDPYGAPPRGNAADPALQGGAPQMQVPPTMVFGQAPAAGVELAQPPAMEQPEVYLYDAARDRAFQLTGQPQRIGRESANDIVIPDINASRVHAEIRMEPSGAWVITDLGSTNGVYINGRKIKSAPLRDADMITIGTTEIEFQLLS